jgi:hypothetical protein
MVLFFVHDTDLTYTNNTSVPFRYESQRTQGIVDLEMVESFSKTIHDIATDLDTNLGDQLKEMKYALNAVSLNSPNITIFTNGPLTAATNATILATYLSAFILLAAERIQIDQRTHIQLDNIPVTNSEIQMRSDLWNAAHLILERPST